MTQTKHVKPQREGEAGQITQRESPIHHSNVMHYSKAQKLRSRVGYKCVLQTDGKLESYS